jgi:hypothetical protein
MALKMRLIRNHVVGVKLRELKGEFHCFRIRLIGQGLSFNQDGQILVYNFCIQNIKKCVLQTQHYYNAFNKLSRGIYICLQSADARNYLQVIERYTDTTMRKREN